MANWLWMVSSILLCLQWIVIRLSGVHLAPELEALSAGIAIFGAAFMLSWAAELAQLEISQTLALALLALIAVSISGPCSSACFRSFTPYRRVG